MLDELFTFPIVMINGDNEEKKMRNKPDLGIPEVDNEEEDYDMVFGEAEYPFWDFIGIEDRWLPSNESFKKAMTGKFEACIVRFLHADHLLVPWTKKKFKSEIIKFQTEYNMNHPPKQSENKKTTIPIVTLTPEQYKRVIDSGSKSEG